MPFQPVHFLLVDDLEENLIALEALLRRDGLVILKARSGVEALEILLEHDIALALVDVQMPGMDGFELAEFMRGRERTRGIPIIFLTAGSADRTRRFQGYEAGAVDFLQKPVDTQVIKSKADVFFELHRRRQEVARQRDELEIAKDEAQKYSAALKKADQNKDEFLATLAHELRNPLAPIRNGFEILRSNPTGAKSKEIISMMDRQLSHMVRLIDDLLDISRISKGKIFLQKEIIDLREALNLAVESANPHILASDHTLEINMPENAVWIDADLTRIGQVIGNLLNNAARYTSPGGKIIIKAFVEDNEAKISVIDNGIGISSDSIEKVFDLFTQVSSTKQSQNGLGIGLALSKHLVEMHGGRISVESSGLGKGSAFTISTPVAEASAKTDAEMENNSSKKIESFKILIVDDNVDSAQTIAWLLDLDGHETILAHTGEDALKMAEKNQPDVILLDIGLPDKNGYEVCKILRNNPLFKKTHIIAQTGWGQKRDKQMAVDAGFDQHLVKPIELKDLKTAISSKSLENI